MERWMVVGGATVAFAGALGALLRPQARQLGAVAAVSGVAVIGASLALRRARGKPPGRSPVAGKPAPTLTEFITDVEGNWEYFCSLVSRSEVLFFDEDGVLRLRDYGMLVFGGDAVDKGTGDLRIVQALLDLKQSAPDRVFFILGNRDVNKLRFPSELAPGETGNNTDVYWDPKHKRYAQFCEENNLRQDSSVSTLQWMLSATMGSPLTFSTRRRELQLLTKADSVSDEDVFQSFKLSVEPSGANPWMLRLIRQGQLAHIIGDCLFVHGGIRHKQMARVPGTDASFANVFDWVSSLNDWCQAQVAEFEANPLWSGPPSDGPNRTRGGNALMDYGLPGGAGGLTVMCENWLDNGNCRPVDLGVEDWLLKQNIRRVFTGHQPHGECPSTIRSPKGLQVMMCDTTYSDFKAPKQENPSNNRGKAVTVVRITSTETIVDGVLADGSPHGFRLRADGEDVAPYDLVGRRLKDNWWVKTVLSDGDLLVAKGEGFKLNTEKLSEDDVRARLA